MRLTSDMKTLTYYSHYIRLLPIIAAAGKDGIRMKDLSSQSGIEYSTLSTWLNTHKRGGMVENRNHIYFLSEKGEAVLKTLPPPNTVLAPIFLDVIGDAGEKGISAKDISERSRIIHDITLAWLRTNCDRFASDRDKVVKVKNGRYGLSKQEGIYYRQRHGVPINGDELDI